MLKRISTNLTNDDMQFYLRRREWQMNRVQNQMGSQTRIQNLRDDPVAAAHATRHDSAITRLERFSWNAQYALSSYRVSEGYMQESVDVLQRIRELGVQGAHGTFSADDLRAMGQEVNELLNELVELANARGGDGTFLFSGDETGQPAFRAVRGNVPGATGAIITNVEYVGTIVERRTELDDGSYIGVNFAGNRVFWAEQQQVYAAQDSTTYLVQQDAAISIDGADIQLREGDNIHAVIAKINESDAAVRARLDPVRSSLVLETTHPHQLWLEDVTGTVLQDLGVLTDTGAPPPQNYAPSARVFGGSVFDMVMHVRDRMLAGDTESIGASGLRGLDDALSGLLSAMAELGAKHERVEFVHGRLSKEIPELVSRKSQEVDLDVSQAITELKMLEYTHRATLGTAGRILQPTLLDFLR
jgi:flagellar hook-associated protein 3 FlgL